MFTISNLWPWRQRWPCGHLDEARTPPPSLIPNPYVVGFLEVQVGYYVILLPRAMFTMSVHHSTIILVVVKVVFQHGAFWSLYYRMRRATNSTNGQLCSRGHHCLRYSRNHTTTTETGWQSHTIDPQTNITPQDLWISSECNNEGTISSNIKKGPVKTAWRGTCFWDSDQRNEK